MRVLMLALNGSKEASTRYRFLQYVPELDRRGHTHTVSTFYLQLPSARRSRTEKLASWTLGLARQALACMRASRFDLVVVQRFICPYLLNDLVRTIDAPVIYDFDDAVWLAEPPRFVRAFDPARTFADLCKSARLVVAGNAFLAEAAKPYARKLAIVPTVVDTTRFLPREKRGAPLLGWIGSPSTFPFLESKLPVLDRIAGERQIRLRIIGAGKRISLRNIVVEQPAWSEEREAEAFGDLDIGLYPLRDDAWSRGKCGLKSIQYMSAGVAQVTSPVGVAKEIAQGAAIFSEDWHESITRLLDDPGLRQTLGAIGRQRAISHYSLAAWQSALVSLYESVVRDRLP
jgi:glycosyltransferase involved in cell wall biosynthesis